MSIQKYNVFCKVDTNTKGHQQWFYFKVKNTRKDVRYHFSVCNFTKPFSLFKQGMQVQMFSKKRQIQHLEELKMEIKDSQEDKKAQISPEAIRFRDEGVVREIWTPAGSKIEYFKSKLERAGWTIPGP